MPVVSIEIKARVPDLAPARTLLRQRQARFVGTDHQTDTYFLIGTGRMKLREGPIENSLIYYERPDQPGPKRSDVRLHTLPGEPLAPGDTLKEVLAAALGVDTIVEKHREIFFVDNVKFHLDTVPGLGCFIEIEALSTDDALPPETLRLQCEVWLEAFGIRSQDLVTCSYSDLLRGKHAAPAENAVTPPAPEGTA